MERVSYRYSLKMGEKNEILKFFMEVYLFLRIFFVIIMKKFVQLKLKLFLVSMIID